MSVRIPAVAPMSRIAIEQVAHTFVAKVSPSTLTGLAKLPVTEIVEFRLEKLFDVLFDVGDLPNDVEARFDGDTLTLSTEVYEQLLQGKPRPRFTVMHEIGHCALHRTILRHLNSKKEQFTAVLYRRGALEAFRDPEWQANAFAAAALMPIGAVQAIAENLRKTFPGLLADRLASKMGVSIDAAQLRVKLLKEQGTI